MRHEVLIESKAGRIDLDYLARFTDAHGRVAFPAPALLTTVQL